MSGSHVSARLRVCSSRALSLCVPCFMLERGVRIRHVIFSAWGNGDSQTLLQLVLCSKLTQCQENADLTMYGFMMKSIRGGLRKIRTRDEQKVHCAIKRSTFRTQERQCYFYVINICMRMVRFVKVYIRLQAQIKFASAREAL